MKFQKIENALQALRDGKNILVMDDETRENEGDLICAAQYATTENVNFMAVHAKGLICMPMSKEVAASLSLAPMVAHNTDNHETAFTYLLTMWIQQPEYQQRNVDLQQENALKTVQNRKISGDRDICSRWLQETAVCWYGTDIQKQP